MVISIGEGVMDISRSKMRILLHNFLDSHPSRALAQQRPMSLLRSRFGAEMLLNELGRIEHGVVS